jgi:hypothetical protein
MIDRDNGTEAVESEMTQEDVLMNESDILRGLLAAAEDKTDEDTNSVPVEIARKGKTLFKFRIRPLGEDEYQQCKDKATKFVKNRNLGGIKMPEDTNPSRYRCLLIYTATIKEDREKVWNNKEAWRQLSVLNGPDLIEKVLLAGEKDRILDKLEEISGYGNGLEEIAKK